MVAATNRQTRVKLIVLLVFAGLLAAALWNSGSDVRVGAQVPTATPTPAAAAPAPAAAPTPEPARVEGCLKCHNNIEPMHRYTGRGDVFDTLDEGKDAQGLT